MFTGIIEATGTVIQAISQGNNKTFWIESPISSKLKVDQSVSHDGVCLTIEEIHDERHRVTAIDETLKKSSLNYWQPGHLINLERSLQLNDRIDGHLVQGHVDATGHCLQVAEKNGSWEYKFRFPEQFQALIIEKGSISINGISLTVFNLTSNEFQVAIIPFTYEYTNMHQIREGMVVNLEFDMIGKYVSRIMLNKM